VLLGESVTWRTAWLLARGGRGNVDVFAVGAENLRVVVRAPEPLDGVHSYIRSAGGRPFGVLYGFGRARESVHGFRGLGVGENMAFRLA